MSEAQTKVMKTDSQMSTKPSRSENGAEKPPSLRSLRVEAEIYAISRTLEYTGWNRKRAASLLKISYRGLLYKIRYHNITRAQ